MTNTAKRRGASVLLAGIAAFGLLSGDGRADDAVPAPPRSPASVTRADAVGWGLASAALSLGSLGAGLLPFPYPNATEISASAPILAFSNGDAFTIGGLQIAEVGGTYALARAKRHDAAVGPYASALGNISFHNSMFAAYATYRDGRARGQSSAWNDGWRPWSAGELVAAPLQPRNLGQTAVFIPLAVEVGVLGTLGIYTALAGPSGTVRAGPLARDLSLGVVQSFDAGVTEEALFRGFLYEELKLSLPKMAARAIDMTLFSLAHVPGEVSAGDTAFSITVGLVTRAVGAWLFERAYDDGGLPESVALHALWDVIAITANLLIGTPSDESVLGRIGTGRRTDAMRTLIVPLFGGTF
jgi:membrane protease YdiL (CAAX protease family)